MLLLLSFDIWLIDVFAGMYNEGFIFCEKVKERLCSAEDYQAFLKLLNIYSNGIIKRNDLQNLVFIFVSFFHNPNTHESPLYYLNILSI